MSNKTKSKIKFGIVILILFLFYNYDERAFNHFAYFIVIFGPIIGFVSLGYNDDLIEKGKLLFQIRQLNLKENLNEREVESKDELLEDLKCLETSIKDQLNVILTVSTIALALFCLNIK
jgi:hypothetical protein